MPSSPSAKYSRPDHPAMKQMLGPERVAALERLLALIDLQLAAVDAGMRKEALAQKRREVEAMVRGARKLRS